MQIVLALDASKRGVCVVRHIAYVQLRVSMDWRIKEQTLNGVVG